MKLTCVSPYRGTVDHIRGLEGSFAAGEAITTSDEVGEFLMRSSPTSFVREGEPLPDGADVIAGAPNRMEKGGRKR